MSLGKKVVLLSILSLFIISCSSSLQYSMDLSSKDAAKRQQAVIAISLLGRKAKKSVNELIPVIINDPDPEVRRLAIEAIGNIRPKMTRELLDALTIASHDENVHIRRATVITAERFEEFPYALIHLLRRRLGDSDRLVRELAMSVFEKVGKAGVHNLIRGLKDPNPDMRLAVVTTLGRMGEDASSAISALKKTHEGDDDVNVKNASGKAIETINQLSAVND
jgi:HEAT repeat protein